MTVLSDHRVLELLHLRDVEGLGVTAIGKASGLPRSTIATVLARVDAEANLAARGSRVTRPENRDGGMWPRWWQDRANGAVT